MTMQKRLLPVVISTLSDDEVEVVMSTGTLARDGHILVPQGAILDSYRANPVVLFQHNADTPVARASNIRVAGNDITATITFAPAGVSAKADEVRGLVKSGIINAVSVGFDPQDGEPIDPKRPRGGMRYTSWELLECSFVSVPADTGAVVTARELDTTGADNAASVAPATDKPTRAAALLTRGLYEVSDLAMMLCSLGYLQSWTEFEAECEGDASEVPAKFKAVLKELGDVFLEMAAEEVGEMFGEDGEVSERARALVRNTRAGKRLSQATIAAIETAITHHDNGIRCLRDIMERDDDDSEMAHAPGATRDANAGLAAALTAADANAGLAAALGEPEARAASLDRLRQLRRAGAVSTRRAA